MGMEESKVQLISKIILAYAVQHNFCILHGMSGRKTMKTLIMTKEITMKFLEMGTRSEKFLRPT